MKKILAVVLFALLSSPRFANAVEPLSAPEIPLDSCYAGNALANITINASKRESVIFARISQIANKELAIVNKYGSGHEDTPIKDIISHDDKVRFDLLHDEETPLFFQGVAEGRLQRDTDVMFRLTRLAEEARDNSLDAKMLQSLAEAAKADKPIPDSEDAQYYLYLLMLRKMLANQDYTTPVMNDTCNLQLALRNEASKGFAQFKDIVANSLEMRDVIALRTKYSIPDGVTSFDAYPLTQEELKRLHHDQNTLSPLMERYSNYNQDMLDIMFFAQASQTYYKWNDADIAELGEKVDAVEAGKLDKERYDKLSKPGQAAMSMWYKIDNEVPDHVTKFLQRSSKKSN